MRSFLQLTYSRLQVNWSKLFSCAAGEARGREREGETAYCESQPEAQRWQKASADRSPPTPTILCPLSTSACFRCQVRGLFPPGLIPSPSTEGLTRAKTVIILSYAESRGASGDWGGYLLCHLCSYFSVPQSLEQDYVYTGVYFRRPIETGQG